jgi:hypothetical protein
MGYLRNAATRLIESWRLPYPEGDIPVECTHPCEVRRLPLECHCDPGGGASGRSNGVGLLFFHQNRKLDLSHPPAQRSHYGRADRAYPSKSPSGFFVIRSQVGIDVGIDGVEGGSTGHARSLARSRRVASPVGTPSTLAVHPWIATVIQGSTASIEGAAHRISRAKRRASSATGIRLECSSCGGRKPPVNYG